MDGGDKLLSSAKKSHWILLESRRLTRKSTDSWLLGGSRDAALLVVTWTNPGRPLATATNNRVWKAMLSPNVRFSHLPQARSLHVLHLLIRFYISIEDGECMVERDLGELKGFNDAHCNVNTALADDLMILRADPVEVRDISPDFTRPDGTSLSNSSLQVPAASCSGLGSKSRRWATLWREVYGARLGCYRKVAPSEHSQRRPGSFVAAKYGVLAAAEYAVASHMQHDDGDDNQDAGALTQLGVPKAFLKSAVGDRANPYGNAKLTRFHALTKSKELSTKLFMGRHLAARKKWKAKTAATSPQKLKDIKKVCFVGESGEKLPHPIADGQPGIEEVEGRNRCRKVDLAVVDDLSRLCNCPDPSSLLHVIGIIGRGVPVITRSSWVLAKGEIDRVPKESVLRHVRLLEKKKVVFEYNEHFKAREALLLAGLVRLSRETKSTWKVRSSSVPAVGESGYEIVK